MLRAVTFGHCYFDTPLARIAPDSEIHFALLLTITSGPLDGVPRDEVVTRLWPRATLDDARHCLRQATYRLRQLAVPVQLSAGRLVLDWSATSIDLHDLLHEAPPRHELVRLGAQEFLPSYTPTLGESYAHWLEALRARVATRLRRALADEVASARARGRFHEMGQVARLLLTLDPLHELGTMVLAESLALEGSKVEALRLLEQYEAEVGTVNANLQLPVRVLRRRVAEVFDDSLMLRRLEVPFVGREREFGALRSIWRDVRAGSSCAVIVTGEAGIGKTRLAGELLRLAALDGATLATYTTSAGDSFTPLSTLVSVGQLLLSLPGALGCDQEHLAYVRRLGTPETVSAWHVAGMAADVLYAQLVQALAELVSAIAEEAPLLLFVDDAERLHPTTWRVIVDVWDRVGHRGVLFLLAARRLPPWLGSLGARSCERLTQHVVVQPFERAESHDFLRAWSARTTIPIADDPAETLAVAARGNPFYLTELAMHVGHGGDPQQTPASIRELIGAQVRVLSRGAQRVLLVVAVLEARATTGRVTQVLEMPAAEFMAALDEVEEAGLVTTQGPAVRVRHRMVAEASTSLATASVVDFVHGRSAALLEDEADATSSVELLGDCVTHWERAGETRRAYEAAMKLGARLVALGLGEEAEKAYGDARRCAQTDDERLAAVSGGITASRLCANWDAVLARCAERRELWPMSLQRHESDHDIELFECEARVFAFYRPTDASMLARIARRKELSPALRFRAAAVMAMVGDNDYDAALVADAFAAVEELPASRIDIADDAPLLQLVYHTSVGDPTLVRGLALAYASASRASSEKRQQIHGLRRAANALVRVGYHDDARPLLEEAMVVSEQLRLPSQTFATSDVLLSSYLLSANVAGATVELERQRKLLAKSETEATRAMLRYSEAQFAWMTRDKAHARALWSSSKQRGRDYLAASEFCSVVGELALRRMVAPASLRKFEMSRCVQLFARGMGFGRQDINASILLSVLRHVGATDLANQSETDYRTRRRELTSGALRAALDVTW